MEKRTWMEIEVDVYGSTEGLHRHQQYSLQFRVKEKEEIMNLITGYVAGDFTAISEINITSIKVGTQCEGCRSDQPNQMAHMELGGCLFQDSP